MEEANNVDPEHIRLIDSQKMPSSPSLGENNRPAAESKILAAAIGAFK